MAPPVLLLRDIRLTFGGNPLFEGVDLQVGPGDRLCLTGRNGSGKSTLLKIAAGEIEPDSGERFVQPGTTMRYLAQEPDLSGFATTLDYAASGLAPGDDPHRPRHLLESLGLGGDEDPRTLSGGEARRCALARTLAPAPDILILDEPTNHLDLPTIVWLERELEGVRTALILVSHDRRFLSRLARVTVWLDRGVARRLDRGFDAFEDWRDEILEAEETERRKRDAKLAAETEWLHKGVTARRKRNQGRLRALRALRAERRQERRHAGSIRLDAGKGARSGDTVVEAVGISKAFAGRVVVRDFSIRIKRGDRIGIVGPNGAGKTTLVKLLTGVLEPDDGGIRQGANLASVTLDQGRESLDPDLTLSEALTGSAGQTVTIGGKPRHVIGFMKDLLFEPEQRSTPLGALSGGERGRVMIARAMTRESNLLVLDEPTNDLDLETLDVVQELLADYAGTVLLVSHDRDFLDRAVTSVIAHDGDGRWIVYAGGYSDMVAQRRGDPDTPPARSKPAPKPEVSRPAGAKAGPRPRLTYADQYALDSLPKEIESLERKIAALNERLADPALFGRDRAAFDRSTAQLEEAEAALAAAEDRWLALEIKREDIDAG